MKQFTDWGFQVGYISSLGQDSLGRHLRAFMMAEGLDLRHLRTDDRYPTGFMLKQMVADGSDPQSLFTITRATPHTGRNSAGRSARGWW